MRPDVPPVENECVEHLGDWIRCEGWHTDAPSAITVNVTGTIDDCTRECLGIASLSPTGPGCTPPTSAAYCTKVNATRRARPSGPKKTVSASIERRA